MNVETENPFVNARIVGENVSGADYRKNVERGDPAYVMSRSDLMEFAWCPSRWRAGYDDDGSKATEWGSLMDALLLGDGPIEQRVAVCPEKYPGKDEKGNEVMKDWTFQAKFCQKWKADQGGKQIVKRGKMDDALEAIVVLCRDDSVMDILGGSKRQVMVRGEYRDQATKVLVPVRGLIDIVPNVKGDFGSMLVDLKTCASAGLRPWAKAVYERGYHVQAALYLDLWNAAADENRSCFGHILQENYAPWQIGKRFLSQESGDSRDMATDRTGAFLSLGRSKYQAALEKYARCLKENVWLGYERFHGEIFPGWENVEPELWMINQL